MLSGIIAYQVLRQENPPTIDNMKAVLEKHPWYASQWQARLQDVPVADRDLVLFMEAARWPDDIRTRDKAQNRPPGITSTYHSNPRRNRIACKPETRSQ